MKDMTKLERRHLDLIKLLNLRLNHFPTQERTGITQTLRQLAYGMTGHIVELRKKRGKYRIAPMNRLDVDHEKLRVLAFVAKEEMYFQHPADRAGKKTPAQLNEDRYESLTTVIDEVGNLIGHWKKRIVGDDGE